MSLEGVGSNTGFQTGEESDQDEGNGGDSERGGRPGRYCREKMPGHGQKPATRTDRRRGGRAEGKGGSRALGSWRDVVIFTKIRHRTALEKMVTVHQKDRKMTSAICPAQGSHNHIENGHSKLWSALQITFYQ